MKVRILTGNDQYRKTLITQGYDVKFREDDSLQKILQTLQPSLLGTVTKVVWENPKPKDVVKVLEESNSNTEILVLVTSLDKRTKAGKTLKKYVEDYSLPKPWEWEKMEKRVEEFFPNLSKDTIAEISEATLGDSAKLADLKDKLSLYSEITPKLIKDALPESIPDIGKLAWKLAMQKPDGLGLLKDTLEKEDTYKVLALLLYRIKDWLKVKQGLRVGLNPYRVKYLQDDVKGMDEGNLGELLTLIMESQRQLLRGESIDLIYKIKRGIYG